MYYMFDIYIRYLHLLLNFFNKYLNNFFNDKILNIVQIKKYRIFSITIYILNIFSHSNFIIECRRMYVLSLLLAPLSSVINFIILDNEVLFVFGSLFDCGYF